MTLLEKMIGSRAARRVLRAIRNFDYEITEGGILVRKEEKLFGGVFRHRHAPAGGEFGPWAVDPNRVVREGLDYILNSALGGQAQITSFFLAPWSGDVEPAATWTGATFRDQATEFTAYTAATRLPWTTQPSTAQAIGNSAALAAATMTFAAGGPYTVRGIALLQASAKSAITGPLVAATRFASARTGMQPGDRLAYEYVFTARDENDNP